MKVRHFILTTGAVLALAVPVAQAANTGNKHGQTRAHTTIAQKNKAITAAEARIVKSYPRAYQTWVQTLLDENRLAASVKS